MGNIALRDSIFFPYAAIYAGVRMVILSDTIKVICLNTLQEGGGKYQLIVGPIGG